MRNNYLQSAIKFYWKTCFPFASHSSKPLRPNQTNFTRIHKLYLCRIYLYFFRFCYCWTEWSGMESKIGLCAELEKKRLQFVKHHMHGAQTICFNQFKLTGISNLEKRCYTGMISLSFTRSSMSLSLLYCFLPFFHPELFVIRRLRAANVCIVQSFVIQQ